MLELSGLLACEELVDLSDQLGELGNEFYDTFRNDCDAEVLAVVSTGCYGISNLVSDLERDCFLAATSSPTRQMLGCVCSAHSSATWEAPAAHDLDEVPVLLGGIGIALDITDYFAVGLCCGIKTEGRLDILVLEVAVDGLGASDDLHTGIVRCHILSKDCCVCVGIVAADDDDGGKAVLLGNFYNDLKLCCCLEFGSAGADDIESAGVSVLIDEIVSHLDIVILDQSARAALEAEKNVVLVGRFECVIQTADNVVSAGCLSAGKDYADNLLLGCRGIRAFLEGDLILAVGVREEGLDLFLIRNALCRSRPVSESRKCRFSACPEAWGHSCILPSEVLKCS